MSRDWILFCLVLFFVTMMADLLVDRQAETITLLRSRGASRLHIFGSFVTQGLGLGLIALVIGPVLAILTTRLLAHQTLAQGDQGVLNILEGNSAQVALGVGWFALAAALGAICAMMLSIKNSTSRDVLEMRREVARSTRRPLWQRLQLDGIAAIIALTGYAVTVCIARSNVFDARVNLLIAALLALVAPLFLVIAGVLLFLRFFPSLL